ncbi:MAG: hypothetical protein KatS3mg003_1196 [Candidatus Nitrosocaldaceae archaeon]|nr:MAG: hypothetical protein KatS3mg003_1196 [Candidatus Nitrosocaldaceae archaeon]
MLCYRYCHIYAFLFKKGCAQKIDGDSAILRNEDGETLRLYI